MKSAEIRAILAENPDAEFAEKPGAHASEITRIRGLSPYADRWTARERWMPNNGGKWSAFDVSRISGPRTWTPGQLMTVAQAEQLLADRRAERAKQAAAERAKVARQQTQRHYAATMANLLRTRGIPCTSSDAGVLLQPDAARELLARLERQEGCL